MSIGAISALKTFRPPPDALVGGTVVDVQRHGKWLDLMVATPTGEPLHLVWHLSRAGWVRWSEQLSTDPSGPASRRWRCGSASTTGRASTSPRPGRASGSRCTSSRTPPTSHRSRRWVSSRCRRSSPERLAELLAARNQQVKGLLRDQGTIAGIGNAYSDEILLAARMSPFAMTRSFDDGPHPLRGDPDVLTGAVASRPASPPPSSRTPSATA